METEVVVGLIGAIGSVIAAVAGALLGRSDFFDRVRQGSKFWSLRGKWDSTWQDIADETQHTWQELLVVERQKGSRVFGYITMEAEPDKRWDFEGLFSGRFFQLMYWPSKQAEASLFLDYGCYLLELQGDGSFNGHPVSFYWDNNKMAVSKQELRRRSVNPQ
jgi:hypothetical protein